MPFTCRCSITSWVRQARREYGVPHNKALLFPVNCVCFAVLVEWEHTSSYLVRLHQHAVIGTPFVLFRACRCWCEREGVIAQAGTERPMGHCLSWMMTGLRGRQEQG